MQKNNTYIMRTDPHRVDDTDAGIFLTRTSNAFISKIIYGVVRQIYFKNFFSPN